MSLLLAAMLLLLGLAAAVASCAVPLSSPLYEPLQRAAPLLR